MTFLVRFAARAALAAAALLAANRFIEGFTLTEGTTPLIIGALTVAALNTFVRPILKFVTTPLRWLTFGLFNIIIYMALLWMADQILVDITISGIQSLFLSSLIIALANIIL